MERQLSVAAYWIAIVCTILAVLTRVLALFGIGVRLESPGRNAISYRTFLNGAEMFFLMAIAGSVLIWTRSYKPELR